MQYYAPNKKQVMQGHATAPANSERLLDASRTNSAKMDIGKYYVVFHVNIQKIMISSEGLRKMVYIEYERVSNLIIKDKNF